MKIIRPNRRLFIAGGLSLAAPAILRAQVPITGAGLPKPAAAGGGEATVLIDTIGGAISSGNGVISFTIGGGATISVGGGPNGTSNLCLMCVALFGSQNGGTSTGLTMRWNPTITPQSFTQVPGAFVQNGAAGGDCYIFYLMNPATGNLSFDANWTGANQCAFFLVSFVHVDQTGGATTFPNVVTTTSSGSSVNISTSPTTRKLIGGFNSTANFTTATDNDIGHNNFMNVFAVAAEYAPGSNSTVSYGGGTTGCALATSIKGA
jgi:hypothetical protein